MAKVLSLGKARKQKRREAERQQADANAIRFGKSREQREREQAEHERARAQIEGHRRDNSGDVGSIDKPRTQESLPESEEPQD